MTTTLTYPPAALRLDEAAEYIGMSPRKLTELQARNEIIPIDVDGMKRYARTELDRYIATRPEWKAK